MHSTVSRLRSSRVVREHEFVAMPPTADPCPAAGRRLPPPRSTPLARRAASTASRPARPAARSARRHTTCFEDLGRRDCPRGTHAETRGSTDPLPISDQPGGAFATQRMRAGAAIHGQSRTWGASTRWELSLANRASASPHWGSCGSWLPSTAARRVRDDPQSHDASRHERACASLWPSTAQEARATQQRRAAAWR